MDTTRARGWIATLWSGACPLPVAFWRFGVGYGLIVNAVTTIGALALFATDAPDWLPVAVHFAPAPYNLLVLVAVWRAASRWPGERRWADMSRAAIVIWVAALTAL
ncbi:MAG: hypothetical protein ACREER_11630 [Alphaproteobacteria bacterium]